MSVEVKLKVFEEIFVLPLYGYEAWVLYVRKLSTMRIITSVRCFDSVRYDSVKER